MPDLKVQPLIGNQTLTGTAPPPPQPTLTMAKPTPQPTITNKQPDLPVLSYYTDNVNNLQENVAPLPEDVKTKMVTKLSQAQQDYPGQEEQILNQFIADNQTKYPAQMGKIQGFLGTNDDTRTERNNNPTAMTVDVARTLGLQEGTDYAQGDPFKTKDGQTLYTAKLFGSDPISVTVNAFNKAAADGTSIFSTSKGKPRWSYMNMTNAQWNAMTPQEKVATVQHMNKMENGPGGSAKQPSGFKPADILNGLIQDNKPENNQIQDNQSTQDRSGGFISRLGNDLQNRYKNLQESSALVDQGKQGNLGYGYQVAGQLAGAATDVIGEGLTSAYRAIVNPYAQKGVQMLGDQVGKYSSPIIQPAVQAYTDWAKQHPVGAANTSALGNIGLLALQFVGGSEDKKAIDTVTSAYEDAMGATKSGLKSSSKVIARSGESPAEFLANAGIPPETAEINGRRVFTTGPDSQTYKAIQERTSALTGLRDAAIDKAGVGMKSSLEDARNLALKEAEKEFSGTARQTMKNHINTEFDAYSEQYANGRYVNMDDMNTIKKDLQGKSNYDTTRPTEKTQANQLMAKVVKEQVEKDAETAGIPGIKEMNKYIQQHLDFLDQGNRKGILSKLNGQVIKGGLMGTYIKEGIGAGIGAGAGKMLGGGLMGELGGGIAGMYGGKLVSKFMQFLGAGGSKSAAVLGRMATENPEVVQRFLDYLERGGEQIAPTVKPTLKLGNLQNKAIYGGNSVLGTMPKLGGQTSGK